MRILHVTHTLPPFSHGGTETYLLALAKAQLAAGHDVSILSGRDAGTQGEPPAAVDGVPVVWLPPTHDYFVANAADAALVAADPQIIHIHHWHHVSFRIARAARCRGAAVVVTLHDYFATCPMFFRLRDGFDPCEPEISLATCASCVGGATATPDLASLIASYREAFRAELFSAHVVLALSDDQRDFLRRVPSLAGVDIRTLPLPAPDLAPPPGVRERHAPGPLRIVTWGGLVPGKGLQTLVESAELLPDPAAVRITHHGRAIDEGYRDRLAALAKRTTLVFAGPYAVEEIANLFSENDLAVFPSLFMETHGLVVDEALLLGLPVVVSDRGAPQLRVGGRGRVFPAGDAQALAAILAEMLADPSTLDRMRAAPPGPMVRFTEHVAALDAVYGQSVHDAAGESRLAAAVARPMRILQVVHGYPPECRGGTETYLPRIGPELARLGHHVEVLTGSHQGGKLVAVERSEHDGVVVHRLHREGLYVSDWDRSFAPEIEPALDLVIRSVRPDVVHVQHWIRLSRHLIAFFQSRGIPTLCTLHDHWTSCPIAFRVRDGDPCERRAGIACAGCAPRGVESDEHEYLEGLELFREDLAQELRLARRVLVPSSAHLAAVLAQHPEIAERAMVVPFCGPREGSPVRARRRTGGPLRAGHWGNLSVLKGIDVLIGAVERLDADTRARFEIHVFGDFVFPEEEQVHLGRARSLGICLHGRYDQADLARADLDLAIIPTRCAESHCYVLDEAFLLGLPAVVTDRGALPERLAGAGTTFRGGSVDDLAAVLSRIAREPEILDGWAARIPDLVSAADHAGALARIYREVIADRSPPWVPNPEVGARRDRLRAHQIETRTRRIDYLRGELANLGSDYARAQSTMADMDRFHREKDVVVAALEREIEELRRSTNR